MKVPPIVLAVLGLCVCATAVAVVHAKHRSRTLFVELQDLQRERDAMQVEWGQLQLEGSTWATHGRIDRIARRRLKLHMPPADGIVVVSP